MDFETKKCANCGMEKQILTNASKSEYFSRKFRPTDDIGASAYFDLWHKFLEHCDNCGYSSENISKISLEVKDFIKTKGMPSLEDNETYKVLSEFRVNNISYLYTAGVLCEKDKNYRESATFYLMAGDDVYSELLNWVDENTEENGRLNASEKQLAEQIEQFGDELFNKGIEMLKQHISNNKNDYNSIILLAGVLSEQGEKEKLESTHLIMQLRNCALNYTQGLMVNYIESTTY